MTDPNSLQAEPGSKSSTRQPPGTATSHARAAATGAAEALMPEGRAAPQREIRNQTPYRIAIGLREEPRRRILHVPPWGSRLLPEEECEKLDLESWESRSIISTRKVMVLPSLASLLASGLALGLLGVGFYAILVWGVWELLWEPPTSYWTYVPQIMLVVGLGGMLLQLHSAGRSKEVTRYLYRKFTFSVSAVFAVLVFLISFGLPLAALLSAEGCCVVPGGATGPMEVFEWLRLQFETDAPRATGRALQLGFIGSVAVMPGFLYFLFDRRKLSSLRERFFRSVVLLDPEIRTLEDAESVYGARADEMLGRPDEAGVTHPHFTRLLIILLATFVITLGWITALDFVAPDTLAVGPDTPGVAPPETSARQLHEYLTPRASPVVFAFLGAYVFAVGMIFRRYVRSDLKPEAYAHVVARIFVAVVVGWVSAVFPFLGPEEGAAPSGVLLTTAFVIGFFPETWITYLREWAQSRASIEVSSVSDPYPLDLLDGVNLYHRARLMDEGVDNIENLAHADIVDLMLHTRIPLETLLDWVDQSILILHALPRGAADTAVGATSLDILRDHGIRNATDLVRAWELAEARNDTAALRSLLGRTENGPWRIRVILDAISDDPWMPQLRRFRRQDPPTRVFSWELLRFWDLGEGVFLNALKRAESVEQAEIETMVPMLMKAPAPAAEQALAVQTSAPVRTPAPDN